MDDLLAIFFSSFERVKLGKVADAARLRGEGRGRGRGRGRSPQPPQVNGPTSGLFVLRATQKGENPFPSRVRTCPNFQTRNGKEAAWTRGTSYLDGFSRFARQFGMLQIVMKMGSAYLVLGSYNSQRNMGN
jgi:hypothetical protein